MQKDVLSPEGAPRDAHWRIGKKLTISFKNLGTLLLSIVLALVVWLFAVNQENPLIVQDLAERVPVTILGPDEGLVPLEDLSKETVKLRLRAPRSSWTDLNVNDFPRIDRSCRSGPRRTQCGDQGHERRSPGRHHRSAAAGTACHVGTAREQRRAGAGCCNGWDCVWL